jgi:hypothetical protein
MAAVGLFDVLKRAAAGGELGITLGEPMNPLIP